MSNSRQIVKYDALIDKLSAHGVNQSTIETIRKYRTASNASLEAAFEELITLIQSEGISDGELNEFGLQLDNLSGVLKMQKIKNKIT